MITCLKCNENKEKSSFIKKSGARPSVVCFSCWKKSSAEDIINAVCTKDESGCILWPDHDRSSDYYNDLRRRLVPKSGKSIYIRCKASCMNSDHFGYFEKKPPTWWLIGFESEEPLNRLKTNSLSNKEIFMVRDFLSKKISTTSPEDCWIPRESISGEYIRVGYKTYCIRNLFFYIYSDSVIKNKNIVVSICGNKSCINPLHQKIYSNAQSFPFWMKVGLPEPKKDFIYCQNDNCNSFGIEVHKEDIMYYDSRISLKRSGKPVCKECFEKLNIKYKLKKSLYDREYSLNNKSKRKIVIDRWKKSVKYKVHSVRRSHLRRAAGQIDKSFLEMLFTKYKNCCYCGRPDEEIPDRPKTKRIKLELEHIVPVACGGTNQISNLEIACWQCNSLKQNILLGEWIRKIIELEKLTDNKSDAEYYRLIIKSTFDKNIITNGKFLPRHMRNNNA